MNIFKSTEIKIIGAFFLVAGLWGFVVFLSKISPFDFLGLLYIFPTVLFGATFYSGYLLLLKENEKGLEIGRAVVALQIVSFKIAGIGYLFVTGAYLFFSFANFDASIKFGVDTNFSINLYDDTSGFAFRVNLLALAVFLYLTRTWKKVESQIEIQEELRKVKEKESLDQTEQINNTI